MTPERVTLERDTREWHETMTLENDQRVTLESDTRERHERALRENVGAHPRPLDDPNTIFVAAVHHINHCRPFIFPCTNIYMVCHIWLEFLKVDISPNLATFSTLTFVGTFCVESIWPEECGLHMSLHLCPFLSIFVQKSLGGITSIIWTTAMMIFLKYLMEVVGAWV